MILAAGLGTRVRPLSTLRPKSLFPILKQPIIDILIRQLEKAGCEAIIINTHHLGDRIADYFSEKDYSIPVTIRFEPTILGTAGGIKNVEDFWDNQPFIVINTDILTDINLLRSYRFHLMHKNPVTLILHDCPKFNNVWVDPDDYVIGFDQAHIVQNRATMFRRLAFTGIQVTEPSILDFIPKKTFSSIIDVYQAMARSDLRIKGYIVSNHYWQDIGSFEGYRQGVRDCLEGRCRLPDILSDVERTYCGNNLVMGAKSEFEEWNAIGDDITIGSNCLITRSIIWNNVTITDRVIIRDSIVGDGAVVDRSISGKIVI